MCISVAMVLYRLADYNNIYGWTIFGYLFLPESLSQNLIFVKYYVYSEINDTF